MARFKPTRFMAEDSKYNKRRQIMPSLLLNASAIPKAHGLERNLNCWTGRSRLSVTCSES